MPFNDLKFTKLLKNVIQKDSNINFLFSIPLADISLTMFTSKGTKSGALLHQLTLDGKLSHSKSHNVSTISKMRDYDKVMSLLDFTAKMQKSDKDQSYTLKSEIDDRELESPTFERTPRLKANRVLNTKIDAFKRSEKTKFEDLKNLIGKF